MTHWTEIESHWPHDEDGLFRCCGVEEETTHWTTDETSDPVYSKIMESEARTMANLATASKKGPETWSGTPDTEHPICWEPADGGECKWTTIAEARRRLENHGWDGNSALAALLNGAKLRTPFAFYSMPKPHA